MTMPSMTTTPPVPATPAQAFYDSVFAKSQNRDMAVKATYQKFGPPDPSAMGLPPQAADVTSQPGGEVGYQEPVPMTMGEQIKNVGRQALQQASVGIADESAGLLGGSRDDWNQKLAEGRERSPLGSVAGMALGMIVPAKAIGTLVGGTANALVRLTGMSPKTANIMGSLTGGAMTSAALGAANAEPGKRLEHVGRDALFGVGAAGAFEIGVAVTPIMTKLLGLRMLNPKLHQAVTDQLILDQLAAKNQTVAEALQRAEKLASIAATSTDKNALVPAVGDALGGPTSQAVLRRVGALPTQEMKGTARAAGMSRTADADRIGQQISALEDALKSTSPIQDAIKGSRVTKGQLEWRAEQFPDPKRAMEIATKDMGLPLEEARQTILLAKQVVETRNGFGKALLQLAERDAPSAKQLVMDAVMGQKLLGGTLGRVAAAVAGPFARMVNAAETKSAMQTLLNTDPVGYLTKLKTLQATQRQIGAVKNATRGAYAGQVAGAVGTQYSKP